MSIRRLNNFSQSASTNYKNKATSQETLFNYQLNCQVSVNSTFISFPCMISKSCSATWIIFLILRYHFLLYYAITLKKFSREQREILITGKMVWGFIVICWISNWMAKVIEADRKGMRNKNTKITKDEIKILCQGRERNNRSQVIGEPQKLPKIMIETEFSIQMDT